MTRVLLALLFTLPSLAFAQRSEQKPEIPVEQWKGKTAVLIGGHADDDELSHGTLALLQAHGNQVSTTSTWATMMASWNLKIARRSWRTWFA